MRCLGLRGSDSRLDGKIIRHLALQEPWVSLDVVFRACHAGK